MRNDRSPVFSLYTNREGKMRQAKASTTAKKSRVVTRTMRNLVVFISTSIISLGLHFEFQTFLITEYVKADCQRFTYDRYEKCLQGQRKDQDDGGDEE